MLAELPREGFNLFLFGWVGGSIAGVGALGALFLWRLQRGATASPMAAARDDEDAGEPV